MIIKHSNVIFDKLSLLDYIERYQITGKLLRVTEPSKYFSYDYLTTKIDISNDEGEFEKQ
jgi:hypothetical protein